MISSSPSYPSTMANLLNDDVSSINVEQLAESIGRSPSPSCVALDMLDHASLGDEKKQQKSTHQQSLLIQDSSSFGDLEWMNSEDYSFASQDQQQQQQDHEILPRNSLLDIPSLEENKNDDDVQIEHQEKALLRRLNSNKEVSHNRKFKLHPRHVMVTSQSTASTKLDSRHQWTIRTSESLFDPDELEQLSMRF